MKAFTGILDQDREILMNIKDDKEMLSVCSLNKYLYNKVCNDMFFRNRLEKTYPGTMKFKPEDKKWKQYYLSVIFYISKMKEKYQYRYREGNPKVQYEIYESLRDIDYYDTDYDELLYEAVLKGEFELVQEALERGAEDEGKAILDASNAGNLEIVKYLVETGSDVNAEDGTPLLFASVRGNLEMVKYLVENGAIVHGSRALKLVDDGDVRDYLESL